MADQTKEYKYSPAAYYATLYPLIKEVVREHGYALAIHGTMNRDFDLLAAPWTETASTPEVLIEAIRIRVDGYIPKNDNPTLKPHGRLAWAMVLEAGCYLDISVMPLQ